MPLIGGYFFPRILLQQFIDLFYYCLSGYFEVDNILEWMTVTAAKG